MTHDTWTDRLSEYVDGELDVATTRALELHLVGCAECRAIADDLRKVSARGRALPELHSRRRSVGRHRSRASTRMAWCHSAPGPAARAAHLLATTRGGRPSCSVSRRVVPSMA